MRTFAKKRIEVIAEKPIEGLLVGKLNELDVAGHTVIPAIGGRGRDGVWRRGGQVSAAEQMIVLICIVDPSRADAVLEAIYDIIAGRIGIVSVSDTQVIRDDRF